MSDPKIRGRTSRLTRRLLGQYLLAVAGFLVALGVGALLAQRICRLFIWQETDPLYQVLSFVKNYLLVFLGGAVYEEVDVVQRAIDPATGICVSTRNMYRNRCEIGYRLPDGTVIQEKG